jgi:hypothetical protein
LHKRVPLFSLVGPAPLSDHLATANATANSTSRAREQDVRIGCCSRVHNSLEQRFLRLGAGQWRSVLVPGYVRTSAGFPRLCRYFQPVAGRLGHDWSAGEMVSHEASTFDGHLLLAQTRVLQSCHSSPVSACFETWRAALNCRHALNSAQISCSLASQTSSHLFVL